jgi:CRP-like cAMP-binding protein
MAADTFLEPLQRVALFQGLSVPQLLLIGRRAERVMFRIGQPIVKAGEAGDGAFLIVFGEGETRSADGADASHPGAAPRLVQTGSLVSEMAMLVETEHPVTIVAKSAIRALKITRAGLYTQMERDPELAAHFVARINGRLMDMAGALRAIDQGLGAALDAAPLDAAPAPGQRRAAG